MYVYYFLQPISKSLSRRAGGALASSPSLKPQRWRPSNAAAVGASPEGLASSSIDEEDDTTYVTPLSKKNQTKKLLFVLLNFFHRSQEQYIAHCQENYSIPGLVDINAGPKGLPFVTLRHPNGARADICLHGGAVTSWRGSDGTEALHLRENNKFDGIDPVAGGINLAWPQIGPGGLPLHGLLRTLHWSVVETTAWEESEDPVPSVSMYVEGAGVGADGWSHPFEAIYTVAMEAPPPVQPHPRERAEAFERVLDNLSEEGRVEAAREVEREAAAKLVEEEEAAAAAAAVAAGGRQGGSPPPPLPEILREPEAPASPPSVLRCTLQIHNNGAEEFKFTAGLLSHFATEDIRTAKKFVKLLGLGGKYALDYAADPMRPQLFIEQGDFVFFDPDSGKNVDKLYVDCDDAGHVLFCPGTQTHIEICHTQGFTDLEVLHPAAAAPDVARRCVCVGSARKARPVTLAPGDTWSGEMQLTLHTTYWDLPPFERADPTTIPVPKKEDALPPKKPGTMGEEFAYIDEFK